MGLFAGCCFDFWNRNDTSLGDGWPVAAARIRQQRNALGKKRFHGRFDLMGRIGLLQEARAGHEPCSHLGGQRAARGIEHRQVGPEADRLISDIIAAKLQLIEPNVDKQRVDRLRCDEVRKRPGQIARSEHGMAQIFEHPPQVEKQERIVFNDKNHGHQCGNKRASGISIGSPSSADRVIQS